MGAKAKHDVAPLLRGTFIEGLKIVSRRKSKTLPEVMADWIEEDWKAVLTAMGKYTVREASVSGKVEHDHKHSTVNVQETLGRLYGMVADSADTGTEGTPEEPLPH